MPKPGITAEFYDRLAAATDEETFFTILGEGQARGYVEIFGMTDQDPKDLTSVLQEHFDVKLISNQDDDKRSE